jgi:MFS family permease
MTTTSSTQKPVDQPQPGMSQIVLFVLLPFGAGYFLSYLFRAVNAVVAPDLTAELGLTAGGLGLLTSAYLFAFAAFQLPLGALLDHFGPRRVQTCMFLVGASGAVLFGLAESESMLILGRALLGLGFAGGLMGAFKAVALWAPPGRMPLLNSWVMAFGGLGVIVSATPADLAVQEFGWRAVFLGLAVITVLVAIAIWTMVPKRGETAATANSSLGDQVRAIRKIYSDREFWRVVPVVTTCCAAHLAIQTLWAGPWLASIGGLERDAVALTLTMMAVAFTVGILGSGALADWTRRRFGKGPMFVMMIALALSIIAQIGLMFGATSGMLVFWLVFAGTGQLGILAYPHLSEHFGAALAGRAGTAVNLLVFGGAFAVQYAIGLVLDLWPSTAIGAPPEAYATAFGIILVLQIVTFGWFYVGQPKRKTS